MTILYTLLVKDSKANYQNEKDASNSAVLNDDYNGATININTKASYSRSPFAAASLPPSSKENRSRVVEMVDTHADDEC